VEHIARKRIRKDQTYTQKTHLKDRVVIKKSIKVKVNNMLKYFNFEEFDCPTLEGSGLPNSDGGKMCIDFLQKLDEAREIAGIPFKITSGYRSPQHNLDVGGRVGSSHIKGLAVDISCTNSVDRQKILTALIKVGFTRIGVGKSFIHTDLDHDKPNALWLY